VAALPWHFLVNLVRFSLPGRTLVAWHFGIDSGCQRIRITLSGCEPEQWSQNQPPAEVPMRTPAPAAPIMTQAPVEPIHRIDLLPVTCPQCGGPIRSDEVKWMGKQSAACPYCGSNLPMKKL